MHLSKISTILSVLLLGACGGGSSDGTTTQTGPTTLTLNVSDAPIDNAISVVVEFDSVELIGEGEPKTYSVKDEQGAAKQINLLAFQGKDFANLLDEVEIEAGTYQQLRLNVTANSFIELDSGTFDLRVPSNQLKLDGFSINESEQALYTVEFDLRKSLVAPPGQGAILLKPRGVRVVANKESGILSGTVDESFMTSEACVDKVNLDMGNAVYVYEGTGLALENLGDDANEPASQNEISPFTVGEVSLNEDSSYAFEVAYLPAGDYTVGFTCLAENDQPETDENSVDGFAIQVQKAITITSQQTTSIVFQ